MLSNLRTEYKVTPLGVDEPRPRFSWECENVRQSSYRLVVTSPAGIVWDTEYVFSSNNLQIEYAGKPLEPFTHYDWRLTVCDGNTCCVSASSWFETGFMGTAWTAPWIEAKRSFDSSLTLSHFTTTFAEQDIVSARLAVTALGIYQAELNGTRIGDDLLSPGWTQYYDRVQYQVYDITSALKKDENALLLRLAYGWYCGRISVLWNSGNTTYGRHPKLRAEIHLELADGSKKVIPVNASNTKTFLIQNHYDIYDGAEHECWRMTQDYVGNYGVPTELPEEGQPPIVWTASEPVTHIMDKKPVSITRRPNGVYIVDFGQNLVGRERFTLRNAAPQTTIFIRHGEMLNPDGSLYYENLRSAKARTIYTSGSAPIETYEPEFTFFGFRYLEVTGWPDDLTADDICARVIHTRLPETGTFHCDNDMLNKLYSNIWWGQRCNFVDVPTDCPQRDERFGWTADTQVFTNVATWNMDCSTFYTKWIADLNLCQDPSGEYPSVAPHPLKGIVPMKGATGWADAGVVCPWVMLLKYADTRLVKKYLPNLLKWLDFEIETSKGTFLLDVANYNDWLFSGWKWALEERVKCPNYTPNEYLSSAYLAGMLLLAEKMLRLTGNEMDADRRHQQYLEARKAIQKTYVTPEHVPTFTSQTGYAMALTWDLFDEETTKNTARLFVENIRDINDCHLTSGFLGTPLLLDALSKIGEVDLAYDLLLQTTYPGWLFPITCGATTMWERWNSWTPEDGFGDVGMNSFNHYAYGAVGAWFYEHICGIQPQSDTADDLAFGRFVLAPEFGHRLNEASGSYRSMRGVIRSEWKRQTDGTVLWKFQVPENAKAIIGIDGCQGYPKGTELIAGNYECICAI